jgi:hypothetical protein
MTNGLTSPLARVVGWTVVYLCGALLLSLLIGLLVSLQALTAEVRETQIEGTPTGKKLLAGSERILDCTDPDGACFKESQARTADAVGDINRVIVLAAACSVGLEKGLTVDQRQTEIQTCVIDRLALERSKP